MRRCARRPGPMRALLGSIVKVVIRRFLFLFFSTKRRLSLVSNGHLAKLNSGIDSKVVTRFFWAERSGMAGIRVSVNVEVNAVHFTVYLRL